MAIDLENSYVSDYIDTLKATNYVNADGIQVTQASNYTAIVDDTLPYIDKRQQNTNRLVAYYTARYNQITRVINKITETFGASMDSDYDTFNGYVATYSGKSSDMDEVAKLINYTIDYNMSNLRELRRQQKILSLTMGNLTNLSDGYVTMADTLNTLKTKLA